MISHILALVSLLVMASANAPIYCGNSTDQVALVTLTNPYNNAAKIDFCSKGSTNIKCSSCEYKSGEHKGDKPEVWTPPQYTVTVGIGADVGFLLFAEEWVHRPRTEGLYPNASGYWPSNYTLPKFPTPVPTCSHQNIPCGQKWDSACCNGLTCKQDDNSFYICQNLTNASPEFNSIVDFAFWPNQAQTLAACTDNNTSPEDSYLCKIDHFEACTISNLKCIGGCDDDTKQRQLFEFLYCFEGEHVKALPNKDYPGPSWLNSLKPCAIKAKLDYDAIQTCATDVSTGSELDQTFNTITNYVNGQKLKFFPWVTLDGTLMGDYCDTCLESWVCGNYTGTSKPLSCSDKRPKVC